MRDNHHGGDWAAFRAVYGRDPLDFSANVSPLGVPEGVAEAMARGAAEAQRYPDPKCHALRERLSETEGVPVSQILCGNGAADLIYRAVLALRPRRALVTAPAFGEYERALALVSCQVTRHSLRPERDFRPGEDLVEAVTPGTELVFLCQPNNPTGVSVPRPILERVLDRCCAVGAVLVVDECFCGFLEDGAGHSMKPFLSAHPNLLLLRAFTKLYALAGLRLGYALCADAAWLAAMDRAGPPWSVSTPAQEAGLAALGDPAYVHRVRTLVGTERPRLAAGLRTLGLRVIPGEANFLLFQSQRELGEPLAKRGILLRGCGNFAGLDETWYRTAVRTAEENQQLLEALGEIVP